VRDVAYGWLHRHSSVAFCARRTRDPSLIRGRLRGDNRRVDGVHDLGGMHGFGPVPIETDEPLFHEAWEGRVWRMRSVMRRYTTNDRIRATIERMPPAEYLASSYYERWLWAFEHLAAEQGMLDRDHRPSVVTPPRRPYRRGRDDSGQVSGSGCGTR
jgi:Nitrile hydratase beta subunit